MRGFNVINASQYALQQRQRLGCVPRAGEFDRIIPASRRRMSLDFACRRCEPTQAGKLVQ